MDAEISVTVARTVFANAESGWFALEAHDTGCGMVRLSRTFGAVVEGMRVTASGRWDKHQGNDVLRVHKNRLYQPSTSERTIRFLATNLISGIGVKTGRAIVASFGSDGLRVVQETPQRLSEANGLGEKAAQ